MLRNLVVCCDGTNNEFGVTNTNVVHLFTMLEQDPTTQLSYYHPGLGTMGAPGAWTRLAKWSSRLLGQAFGRGLADDVRDAYVFLMQNYAPDDRVFLFGFSRGAYTVRVLAGMLHMFGLVRAGNEPLVPYAIRMLTKEPNRDAFAVAANFKATFSRECKPYFVGVWDTVSSVGWFRNPLKIPYSANNPDIAIARQAIAIDERRAFFRQNLWRPGNVANTNGPKDVREVWFPGVHCDVGGGYPEKESGLSKIALKWMVDEATSHGLSISEMKRDQILSQGRGNSTTPDRSAAMHNSLTTKWWIAEFVPKKHYDAKTRKTGYRMNLFRRRRIPENALIHDAAFERGEGYPKNKPQNYTRISR